MSASLLQWLRSFIPVANPPNLRECLRASLGAFIGIGLTGAISHAALGNASDAIWLIAPMGASTVLLFAVPASPLAQPWSFFGGNLVAAVVGITCAKLIASPVIAAALAIAFAIAGMILLRCVHPPSGAVALTTVLGGPIIHAAGYGFIVYPLGLNTLLLLATALVYNNLTEHRYPHVFILPSDKAGNGDKR